MKGVVVQIVDFACRYDLQNKRGYIEELYTKSPLTYKVNIDQETLVIPNENLFKVYCLGIPMEYWKCEKCSKKEMIHAMLSQINSTVFYVFVKEEGKWSTAFLINAKWFDIACEKMSTEPLLRIYTTTQSQSQGLLFDQCCAQVSDVSKPWFIDLHPNRLFELISRFQSVDDEKQLKVMNAHDHTS